MDTVVFLIGAEISTLLQLALTIVVMLRHVQNVILYHADTIENMDAVNLELIAYCLYKHVSSASFDNAEKESIRDLKMKTAA